MKRILMIIVMAGIIYSSYAGREVLLIGIGHYPADSDWMSISSDNDISLLKDKVFKSLEPSTLTNKDATHKGIIKAINNLIVDSEEGDTILIHFSCHGQQMLTNDNNEPDHLDEALVPYDAFSKETKCYWGQNHLTDNELGELIKKLRNKLGKEGLVIITIDACFSDSMDKGEKKKTNVIYRGGAEIFGSNTISKDSLYAIQKRRKLSDDDLIENFPNGANVVIISACKTYQRNIEVVKNGIGYGSLSYAMYASAKQNGMTNLYKWFDGIYRQIQKDAFTQTPQIKTTLSYTFPVKKGLNPKKNTQIVQKQSSNTVVIVLLVAIILVLIIVLYFIWKQKRKK